MIRNRAGTMASKNIWIKVKKLSTNRKVKRVKLIIKSWRRKMLKSRKKSNQKKNKRKEKIHKNQ